MTRYYGSFDETTGEPDGLFRMVVDDASQQLHLERLTQDGTWQDDPELIDELREPGVRELQASEVGDVLEAFGQKRELANDPEASPPAGGQPGNADAGLVAPNSVR